MHPSEPNQLRWITPTIGPVESDLKEVGLESLVSGLFYSKLPSETP